MREKSVDNPASASTGKFVYEHIKRQWLLVILPSICYFFMVSKIAVMIIPRYLTPVYAVIIIVISVFIYVIGQQITEKKKRSLIFCILYAVIIVNSWKSCSWEYLYLDSAAFVEKVKEHRNENSIYIYDSKWKICASFGELLEYKSVTFFHRDNLDAIQSLPYKNDDSLVVSIDKSYEAEEILSQILEICPLLDSYEFIGSFGYSSSWYLYGQNLNVQQYRLYDYNHTKFVGSDEDSVGENIYTTVKDTMIKGILHEDTGYMTLWIGNNVFDIQSGLISDGSNIRLWSYNGTNAQLWKIKKNKDDTVTILSCNEQLAMAKDSDGNICLRALKEDDESQKWWIERDGMN